ncbi:MAG: hypothetical protein ACRDL6_06985 [Solirubrobacterales bacterium]
MHTERSEAIEEASKWGVGLGTLTLALAPLSLPFLILTAAALLPLLIPVLAVGLVAAIVTMVTLAVRGLGRLIVRGVSSSRPASPERAPRPGSRPAQSWR